MLFIVPCAERVVTCGLKQTHLCSLVNCSRTCRLVYFKGTMSQAFPLQCNTKLACRPVRRVVLITRLQTKKSPSFVEPDDSLKCPKRPASLVTDLRYMNPVHNPVSSFCILHNLRDAAYVWSSRQWEALTYSRTPIIRSPTNRIASYPDRLAIVLCFKCTWPPSPTAPHTYQGPPTKNFVGHGLVPLEWTSTPQTTDLYFFICVTSYWSFLSFILVLVFSIPNYPNFLYPEN
jgi:hypothetical protein